MKRENLQRAQKIEDELCKREKLLRLLEQTPVVGIGNSISNMMLYDKAIGGTDDPFQQEAVEFVNSVYGRIRTECDSLLKEMEEL